MCSHCDCIHSLSVFVFCIVSKSPVKESVLNTALVASRLLCINMWKTDLLQVRDITCLATLKRVEGIFTFSSRPQILRLPLINSHTGHFSWKTNY